MLMIGVDYRPSMQQIAWVDTQTGECGERRLMHRAEAERIPEVKRLMTHPGVGPITTLAFVLVGTLDRFCCGKQVAGYLGLIP